MLADAIAADDPGRLGSSLPAGWRKVRFGDVVRNVKVTVDPEESGLERYVAGEHMDTDDLHIRRWGTVGDGYLGPAFHRKFAKGQVLYGSRRTYLRKVAVADFDGICANTTFVLEPNGHDLLPELLPFIMQTTSFVENSIKMPKGSVNPYVNWPDIASYEFDLPPLDEQCRIADILWAADILVGRFGDCILHLITYRSALFEHLLNADSASSNSSSYPEVRFDSLLLESPQSGFSAVSAGHDTGHYVLALSALTATGYQSGHLKPVVLRPEIAATKLQRGDLLISRSNTIYGGPLCQDTEAGAKTQTVDSSPFPESFPAVAADGVPKYSVAGVR